ncbi:zinc finger MYM-type protein 1-like [Entelurus aequoreus]|uniref:zinc finger MYM-type protein 1-like n=1 Tax=Entelurus aequoreus TaxID=161455 RepID=UPI002B1E0C87|nr:zinc finger MYM-type protein 1-like [Entelurus aequoreus]
MYSKKEDSLHCFCCKMFSKRDYKLSREGLKDWKNASHLLKVHEESQEHNAHMATWKDLEVRFAKGLTIDKQEMALAEAERKRWREVLHRLVAIIQSLAERNMAFKFRGSTDTLNKPDHGNFLKEVELMAKCDPVMKQHVGRVESGAGSDVHYLGKTIQNELIDSISSRIIKRIVEKIKTSKYFSIILACTPDLSHKEQLSVIVRIVSQEDIPQVKEHFLGFLVAEESTGDTLSTLILKRLEELNIPFEDCRGQSYDNGANMKGKNKGVQARLLQLNSRAFFVPCAYLPTLPFLAGESRYSALLPTTSRQRFSLDKLPVFSRSWRPRLKKKKSAAAAIGPDQPPGTSTGVAIACQGRSSPGSKD